jgi:hypothetical protein
MSFNLIDSVRGFFGNERIGKAASAPAENQTNKQNTVTEFVPSVLTGQLHETGSDDPANARTIESRGWSIYLIN